MHFVDGPPITKVILDLVNPVSKVSTRHMKDKPLVVDINSFKGDRNEMLHEMEEMHSSVLAKGKNHTDFSINLLNDLLTVSDKSFLFTVEQTQDACDSDEDLSTE